MSTVPPLTRSPDLMNADDTALLVVDVQGKLITLVPGHERIVWNIGRLIDGANLLGVKQGLTEQYPKGLGPTVSELAQRLPAAVEKLTFSCGSCSTLFNEWRAAGIYRVLVVGIETHVCIQQTVFDLLADGWRVYLAVDATGSRYDIDRETALRRMESGGATLTTTESALFEWCQVAGTPQFKALSKLVQQPPPV